MLLLDVKIFSELYFIELLGIFFPTLHWVRLLLKQKRFVFHMHTG